MSDTLNDLAQKIPPQLRFGTSSWNYPGWKGTVYFEDYPSERSFTEKALTEYARVPLFRTVGIDNSFYKPLGPKLLARYHAQLPPDFTWLSKVWEEITIPIYSRHARYGPGAGRTNPNFLNADLFIERVLGPFIDNRAFRARQDIFVFEFQTMGRATTANPKTFFDALDTFFTRIPKDFRYSTEIRDESLLNRDYIDLLNQHGVTHCFNHWTRMPRLREQMKRIAEFGGLTAPFYAARLLTPIGMSYEEAVNTFSPYSEIKRPNLQMRHDVVTLARRAISRNVPALIIVNNRLEGHAPGTIKEIATLLTNDAPPRAVTLT